LNWKEALDYCKAKGMRLATFESKHKQDIILSVMSKIYPFGIPPFKFISIGGTKSKDSEKWYWPETGEEINYKIQWNPNEPNYKKRNEYCLNTSIQGERKVFGINAGSCEKERDIFLCEKYEVSV
jgi:hypothetical protein